LAGAGAKGDTFYTSAAGATNVSGRKTVLIFCITAVQCQQ